MTEHNASDKAPSLIIDQIAVGYGGKAILPPISFNLEHHQFWALIGSNGSGKSTLLRTILGLQPKISGQFHQCPSCKIGYVPQRSAVDSDVPTRVIDVVRSGADFRWSFLKPTLGASAKVDVDEALADMALQGLEYTQFHRLSEGQKQRVLMARALASRPSIFVLDEPTSAMDFEAEASTFEMLQKVRHARGLTILMVSHQVPILWRNASHGVLLDKDRQLVLTGPLHEIQSHAFFLERYGQLVGADQP